MKESHVEIVPDINEVNIVNMASHSTPENAPLNVEGEVDFTTESFMTRQNPTAEVTSMLSSLYMVDDYENSDDDVGNDAGCDVLKGDGMKAVQSDTTQVKSDLLALSQQMQTIDVYFKQLKDSTLNREVSFRHAMDTSLAKLNYYFNKFLEKLERAVADCFLRRMLNGKVK